jgi:hypothetical protein
LARKPASKLLKPVLIDLQVGTENANHTVGQKSWQTKNKTCTSTKVVLNAHLPTKESI